MHSNEDQKLESPQPRLTMGELMKALFGLFWLVLLLIAGFFMLATKMDADRPDSDDELNLTYPKYKDHAKTGSQILKPSGD